jgi:hypothetical protein
MAFTKTLYDKSLYEDSVKRSQRVGQYRLEQPLFFNKAPYPDDVRIGNPSGPATTNFQNRVDLESDLKGYTRPPSKELVNQHNPGNNSYRLYNHNIVNFNVNETILENPPCTLRGTGYNRWDWLPINPQKAVTTEFNHMVDTRQLEKDRHYQCYINNSDQNKLMNQVFLKSSQEGQKQYVRHQFTRTG